VARFFSYEFCSAVVKNSVSHEILACISHDLSVTDRSHYRIIAYPGGL